MGYQKALKKLESLPPGERQLAAGQYVWEVKNGKSHCGCAIGKLLTERQRVKLFRSKESEAPNKSGTGTLAMFLGIVSNGFADDDFGVAGLTFHEAEQLQAENDTFLGSGHRNAYADRKARYRHVIAWLKEKIANPEPQQEYTF